MFDRKNWLVKERVGFLKLVDTFDIYDPATGKQIGIAREQVSIPVHILRFLINKRSSRCTSRCASARMDA